MRLIIVALAALAVAACGGGGATPSSTTTTLAPTQTTIPAATPDPFTKAIYPNRSQTIQGVTVTVQAVRIGTVAEVLAGQSATTVAQYARGRSIIIVNFEVYNSTNVEQTIQPYTGTTALINDEQLDADSALSKFEVRIMPGARLDLHAGFVSSRYAPPAISDVRFDLDKEFDRSFDFPISMNR